MQIRVFFVVCVLFPAGIVCSAQSKAVSSTSGPIIFTVAGGTFGDGRLANTVGIGSVDDGSSGGVVTDTKGNVYVLDSDNFLIRKIDTNGIISTVAGNGIPTGPVIDDFPTDAGIVSSGDPQNGDGGKATNAELGYTDSLRIDGVGNLYFTDNDTRIRKVDTHGIITTVAGDGTEGNSGDGGLATSAEISSYDFQLDAVGNIYFISTTYTGSTLTDIRIRKVDTNGIITTFAGNGTAGVSGDGGARH